MTLQIWKLPEKNYPRWKIDEYRIELDYPYSNHIHIGIDPGTANIGVATLMPKSDVAFVYEITMERIADPILRILSVRELLSDIIWTFTVPTYALIEGSAFSKGYRQTELAEFRAAAVLWCTTKGIIPKLGNPQSIRKVVFGSAKKKAENVWPYIPGDAASALACSLYSIILETKE